MSITIIGLGPGNGRFLTQEAWQRLSQATTLYLRTKQHPAVADLPPHLTLITFDELYHNAKDFAEVYQTIVAQLLQAAQADEIFYAVPGHPLIGESTVTRLLTAAAQQQITTHIVAGVSFVEPVLTAVGQDGMNGLQIFDALDTVNSLYPNLNCNAPALFGQVYSRFIAGELKLALMNIYPDEHPVQLVHGAGTATEIVEDMALYEIDRSTQTSYLTSLYLPALPQPASLSAFAETVAILRSPAGCPWDQEQTPQTMRAGLLEEASEVLEALDNNDPEALREELGDLLYHIVMQTTMATETAGFKLSDVIAGIDAKLKYRHPHVWGDWQVADSDEVVSNWEMLKAQEKAAKPDSLLAHIPQALPALARSQKIQARVHKVGFDWPAITGVYEKMYEEIAELQQANTADAQQEELGDLLFVIVNVARWLDLDAETALRMANAKFIRRFQWLEKLAAAENSALQSLTLAQLEVLWQKAKIALADEVDTIAGDD